MVTDMATVIHIIIHIQNVLLIKEVRTHAELSVAVVVIARLATAQQIITGVTFVAPMQIRAAKDQQLAMDVNSTEKQR